MNFDLSRHYAIAYLLSQGIAEETIGAEKVARLREHLLVVKPAATPPREAWTYEELLRHYCATYQTAELG